ncbi:chorismate dehydratase [Abditibacteriota bacterium]|nr:chorismate dehydratase [Abditibacteriota bacterium]
MKWVLGTVSYLNALPLIWALERRDDVELVRMLPSQLGQKLEEGELHASLSPVFDVLSGIGETILGDGIVGATRDVRSVLLFHRKPIAQLESVALDTSSHSSVNLTRVLLRDSYHTNPRFVDHKPDLRAMLRENDGAVLIGDPALEAAQAPAEWQVLDLARAWNDLTGFSFTFAAWTGRRGLTKGQAQELTALLNWARDEGTAHIEQIVLENPTHSPLAPSIRESYLRNAIEYRLSPAHEAGLREFACRLHLPFPRLLRG